MITSENITNIVTALVAASANLKNVPKTLENKFGGYKYAPLEAVLDAINAAILPHGMKFMQNAAVGPDRGLLVLSSLFHVSGEWMRTEGMPMPIEERKGMTMAQSAGASDTYGRRYEALAFFGIAAEGEDNDAADHGREESVGEARARAVKNLRAGRGFPRRGEPGHGISERQETEDDFRPDYGPRGDLP